MHKPKLSPSHLALILDLLTKIQDAQRTRPIVEPEELPALRSKLDEVLAEISKLEGPGATAKNVESLAGILVSKRAQRDLLNHKIEKLSGAHSADKQSASQEQAERIRAHFAEARSVLVDVSKTLLDQHREALALALAPYTTGGIPVENHLGLCPWLLHYARKIRTLEQEWPGDEKIVPWLQAASRAEDFLMP